MENKELGSVELYKKGEKLTEEIDKYSNDIVNASGEEKEILNKKVLELKEEKNKLKDEIYKQAKEKSGLDYAKDDKNPELLRKKYNEEIQKLKKRKQDLSLERRRIEKIRKEKIVQMEEQFNIAVEKYKAMLDMNKITPELYESRIENMKIAKMNDKIDFVDKLDSIKEESNKIDSKIHGINGKLDELNKKEIIYNEYGDIYYRLYGEVLSDRNKLEKKLTVDEKNENTKTSSKESIVNEEKTESVEKASEVNSNIASQPTNITSNQPQATNTEVEKPQKEENKENENVIVTSKSGFDSLYKKMKKGNITDKELSALSEVLANPDNYDKYGITTGIVFNKAKKILKYQGARTASNIEQFLRENGKFNDNIIFDTGIEKDNILSHDILNSWKNIDEKLIYTDSVFSVEKYIDKIEKYKEEGNILNDEQEKIFKRACEIKNNLSIYRKAINTNQEVSIERDVKSRNSIFYHVFKNRFKSEATRALPEKRNREENPGYIVMDRINLSSLVNNEPTREDLDNDKTDIKRDEKDEIVK